MIWHSYLTMDQHVKRPLDVFTPKQNTSLFLYLQLWDATNGKCVATLTGHDDEILDSCFDYAGKLFATASADGR